MLTWNELVTRDELKKEYWNAANALDVAYNHFNNAEPMFIDAAWNLLWALNQRKTHPELDDLYSHKEIRERR